MNQKRQRTINLTLSYVVIIIMAVIILYPILWIIGSSLNPGNSLSGSSVIPKDATFAHYKDLFNTEKSNYLLWYWNTMKICVLTMVASVALVSFTALFLFQISLYWKEKWFNDLSNFANDS